ncbi:MAG: cytochrome c prime [Hyphomicrobiales bacterium]|nr:cytochrome c prime [Hyphomicrobiales bacterium]
MIRGILVAGALVAGLSTVSAVMAQSDPITERQQAMKGLSQAARAPGAMLKGEAPFDLATVQTTLKTFADTAKAGPALFPDNSKTGHDTAALPAVWTNKADFNMQFAKFGEAAVAAQASIKDEASFKANFPNVLKTCGGCHETYRAKKS